MQLTVKRSEPHLKLLRETCRPLATKEMAGTDSTSAQSYVGSTPMANQASQARVCVMRGISQEVKAAFSRGFLKALSAST